MLKSSDLAVINTLVSEEAVDRIKATYFSTKNYPISYQGTTDGGNMIEGSIYSADIETQRRTYWEVKKAQVRTKVSGVWSEWVSYVLTSDIKYKRALVSNTVDGYGYITDPDATATSIIIANTEGVGAVFITGTYVMNHNITFWFSVKNTGQYYVKYTVLNL